MFLLILISYCCAFEINLNDDLPSKKQLQNEIKGNISNLPNPVLSSYFAYRTRLFYNSSIDKGENGVISYFLDETITFNGNSSINKFKNALLQVASLFDEITKDILYSSRSVHLNSISQTDLIDYNFECVDDDLTSLQIRNYNRKGHSRTQFENKCILGFKKNSL